MVPYAFDYVRAESLEQAVSLLADDDVKVLAGGHSLIPMLKLRLASPTRLVDIGRLETLHGITDGDTIQVGSLTTHHEMATSAILHQKAHVLAEAAAKVGDPQVRNKGTLGGNIAHADPASDLPAALVALGATVRLLGSGGERSVAAADFFVDLLETALDEGEIILGVDIPALDAGDASAYVKHEHPASGYAVVGAAAVVRGGSVSVALNGATASVHHAADVGEALSGSDLSDEAIAAAHTAMALPLDELLSDVHASAEYRGHLAAIYTGRALLLARARR
ncbi:MAG: FAD binding domain-containing protein [Acidobacteriota bacterium]